MNPGRSRGYKLLTLGTSVLCLAGVFFVQNTLNRDRETMGLTRLAPLENAPPALAFTTVALGGFRGLIVNMLWVRATQMQDEGRYFEMVQLADWITKLQPHFVTVWVNQAWNLSYNISVKFTDHADRWLWVQRGIELLRDRGIPLNPQETLLYRELAWHFQHKMGDNMDDAHMLYKNEWAKQMDELFDGRIPDFDRFADPQTDADREKARRLTEDYKMDIAVIREVEERYGPLEWRLPETHGIYWAHLGLKKSTRQTDYITLRRVLYQCMQKAFHRGRLFKLPVAEERERDMYILNFGFSPNIDITANVNRIYEEEMAAAPDQKENIATAHKNFLRTAIYFLYTHNRTAEAQQYYDYVRELYPASIEPDVSLEEYVFRRVEEEFASTSQDRTKAMLQGLLTQSFVLLTLNEEQRAQGFELLVNKMWRRFHLELGKNQDVRVGLPTVRELKRDALREFMAPESPFSEQAKDRLRTRLGPELKAFLEPVPEAENEEAPGSAP